MTRLQECPAIKTLNEILGVFPGLRRDRLVDVRPATRHTSGLAIDIFFNSHVPRDKARGLELIDVFVKHHKAMQWSDLIFTSFHIGGGVGGYMGDGHTKFSWTGGGHDDHIHLDWVNLNLITGPKGSEAYIDNPYVWSEAAKRTEWRGALETDLRALASRWAADEPPTAQPMPQWLPGWWRVVQDGETCYYYIDAAGSVVWTYQRPVHQSTTVTDQRNRGTCTVSMGGELSLVWNEIGGMSTVEVFRKISSTSLRGSSNRSGPLVMTRL